MSVETRATIDPPFTTRMRPSGSGSAVEFNLSPPRLTRDQLTLQIIEIEIQSESRRRWNRELTLLHGRRTALHHFFDMSGRPAKRAFAAVEIVNRAPEMRAGIGEDNRSHVVQRHRRAGLVGVVGNLPRTGQPAAKCQVRMNNVAGLRVNKWLESAY